MKKGNAAFTLNMMCRSIFQVMEDHVQTTQQNGERMSPTVAKAFTNLCHALKELDNVTGKEH